MVRLKHRYLLVHILFPDVPSELTDTTGAANPAASTTPTSASAPSGAPLVRPRTRSQKKYALALRRPSPDALTPGALVRMLRDTVGDLFGDWGMGKLGGAAAGGIGVKYLSPATGTAIIRCPRASYRLAWAALTHLSAVPLSKDKNKEKDNSKSQGKDVPMCGCVFRVVRVSGTMRKAEEEAIRRARADVVRMRMADEEYGAGGKILDGLFAPAADTGSENRGIEVESEGDEQDSEDE